MADIETSVVISARTDDLQSGREVASSAVQAATDAMRAQFAALGAAAQQAQAQLGAAAGQIGASIGTLQAKAANLAGSVGDGIASKAGGSSGRSFGHGMTRQSGTGPAQVGASSDSVRTWRAELQEQLLAEHNFFGQSKDEELAFWQDKLALADAGSSARLAV